MAEPTSPSRIQAVVGPSWRLRDEAVAALTAAWTGPVKRCAEPDDLAGLLLGLDTPSLFEEPALTIVRAGPVWLRRNREALAAAVAPATGGGAVLLSAAELDGRDAFTKALAKAGALHAAAPPNGKALSGWLAERLSRHPQGVDQPRRVADALVEHLGEEVDALLTAIDVVAIHAGDRPMSAADVDAVVGGVGERPIWDFTGAVLDGQTPRALDLMYAGGGLDPGRALSALANELRKLLACCDAADDDQAARLAGMRGATGAMYYARKRAKSLGKPLLTRLLTGAYLCQRQLRQSGVHAETAVEMLVLHAQRVIRPAGR